jgi:hypothetical protein
VTDLPAPVLLPDGTVQPLTDLPLSAAVEELTGFETLAIEAHFRQQFNDLGGVKSLIGAAWAYGNRNGQTLSWNAIKALTLKQLGGLFGDEPQDADESEPDSELGKGS